MHPHRTEESAWMPPAGPAARLPLGAVIIVAAAVLGFSLYANASYLVKDWNSYRFFPPFERGNNRNHNGHLAAEYYSIAGAMVAGRGYADPFHDQTGPTAWMPPVLPVILAGLRLVAGNDKEVVIALFILLQDLTLIGTGILLLILAQKTTGRVGIATLVFVVALLWHFRFGFQFTHDCWIILAVLDLLIAGLIWLRPLQGTWRRAAGWGIFGGLCALTSPVVGFTWGIIALATGWQRAERRRLAVAVLASMLTVTPWVIRNYLVFGRFIPVKSNLAYELYQSQCLVPGGVLRASAFGSHPFVGRNMERSEYARLGEIAYLDGKMELFKKAVKAKPGDFAERVANRFLAATFLYIPFEPNNEARRPWMLWFSRLAYPIPFLCLLVLLVTTPWRPLTRPQWIVIGVYLVYLLPYVLVSYYDRYKFPVLLTEALLFVWAVDRAWALLGGLLEVEPLAVIEVAEPEEEALDVIEIAEPEEEPLTAVIAEPVPEELPVITAEVADPLPELARPVSPELVSFECPCGKKLKAKALLAGKKLTCPKCGKPVIVPGGPPAVRKDAVRAAQREVP